MQNKPTDPNLKSWVQVKKDSDFPIQNIPFGIFKTDVKKPRAGVAIGDYILDLAILYDHGFFATLPEIKTNVFESETLNSFIGLGKPLTSEVRNTIIALLDKDNSTLRDNTLIKDIALIPQKDAEMCLPLKVENYTDFYSSLEHATNVGTMFRGKDNALMPNWKHLPIAYHGRASSIILSGQPIHRPKGQLKKPDEEKPHFEASQKLDFELEMAFVTCGENELGTPIPIGKTEEYIFGFVLFNDWSARDIQVWEYQPLGPFLAKNFASSVSPWIVTLDALEPFRTAGPKQDPPVLPYLQFSGNKNFDINLNVYIQTEDCQETQICQSNFKYMYWNICQQLAHHTITGCNVKVGDMYASGTISGPKAGTYGSLLELAWKGTKPIKLNDGSERSFLQDGDTVIMRGYAQNGDLKIGFGEVKSKVLPAK